MAIKFIQFWCKLCGGLLRQSHYHTRIKNSLLYWCKGITILIHIIYKTLFHTLANNWYIYGSFYVSTIVTGPPVITTHPSSQLITSNMSITLTCEGTGRGTIMYRWENSNINGGQWMRISTSNSRILVVKDEEDSEFYRCVASNDVGETESNIATIIVLSKYNIIMEPYIFIIVHL